MNWEQAYRILYTKYDDLHVRYMEHMQEDVRLAKKELRACYAIVGVCVCAVALVVVAMVL
jgi:hypothetical protein